MKKATATGSSEPFSSASPPPANGGTSADGLVGLIRSLSGQNSTPSPPKAASGNPQAPFGTGGLGGTSGGFTPFAQPSAPASGGIPDKPAGGKPDQGGAPPQPASGAPDLLSGLLGGLLGGGNAKPAEGKPPLPASPPAAAPRNPYGELAERHDKIAARIKKKYKS